MNPVPRAKASARTWRLSEGQIMPPRNRLNALLAILVLAVGTAAMWFGERDEAVQPAALTPLKPHQITHFSLFDAEGRAVSLVKMTDGWRIDGPLRIKANSLRVSSLLGILTTPSLGGFRAAGNDLGTFQLAPPLARLLVAGRQLHFGDTEPVDGRRYVLIDDEVHLIEDSLFTFLPVQAAIFVNLAPFADAQRVTAVRHGASSMTWRKSRWESEGFGAPGPDWFNQRAERWLHLQAVRVSPFEASAHRQHAIEFDIVVGQATVTRRFVLRRTEHEVILGRPDKGIQYHLLKRSALPLLRPRES